MALLADIDDSYTKTGKGTLARWSSTISWIPGIRNIGNLFEKIPFLKGTWGAALGYIDTVIESARWLFRGEFGSAATAAVAGFVGTTADFASQEPWFWWANAGSKALTGATVGTHARAATEAVIGAVTGAIGAKPTVLGDYPRVTASNFAAVGSTGAGQMQSGPGKFFSDAARSKGENPDAAYARMQAGQADHLAALEAARAQGLNTQRAV